MKDIRGFISPRDDEEFDGRARRPAPKLVRIERADLDWLDWCGGGADIATVIF